MEKGKIDNKSAMGHVLVFPYLAAVPRALRGRKLSAV
jgi:hypothetical protein